MLTSRDDENDIVEGLDSGADDYIVKPFKNSELRSRVNAGRRMLELQASLLEKEKLQGVIEMSGAVCHEMNQPLQVVSGIAELLMMDIEEGNPLYKKIIMLKEQTERMGKITNKLMSVTSYKTKAYLDNNIIDIDQSSKDKK
jgi:C4-dicarboxylate-specific signal transduction histidine kinase